MIEAMLLALLAKAGAGYEPPPELWYREAVACAVSVKLASGKEPNGDQFGQLVTWGMIMADAGRKSGRTKAQVDHQDLEAAEPFFRHLKSKKPPAFAARLAYCSAVLDADRP